MAEEEVQEVQQVQDPGERIAELERRVEELGRRLSMPMQLPVVSPVPGDGGDDLDGAEAPPCMELETEMVVSDDTVCGDGAKVAWRWSRAQQKFERARILLGNDLQVVTTGNASIVAPTAGSGITNSYYVKVTHGTSGTPSAELVTSQGSNTDTVTYIWVADIDETGQVDGVYSVPSVPLYCA